MASEWKIKVNGALKPFWGIIFLPSTATKTRPWKFLWQLVNTANAPLLSLGSNLFVGTGELTHPALSTNCKSDPPLWLVKRKWHLWQLSSAEPAWKWDSQRSQPEAFFFLPARRFDQRFASQISKWKKDNCQRAQPSEAARLARRQHYRAVLIAEKISSACKVTFLL